MIKSDAALIRLVNSDKLSGFGITAQSLGPFQKDEIVMRQEMKATTYAQPGFLRSHRCGVPRLLKCSSSM